MEIKHVELVFENIDVISLDPNQIKWLNIEGINNNIAFNGIQTIEQVSCDYFIIEIKDPKNIEHYEHGIDEFKTTAFGRICMNDLTHISITYTDGSDDYISIPYTEEQYNPYQRNTYDEEYKILTVQANRYSYYLEED